jgi:hypothetical protein
MILECGYQNFFKESTNRGLGFDHLMGRRNTAAKNQKVDDT